MSHLRDHFWSWYVSQSFPGNYIWYSWVFHYNNLFLVQICHEGRRLSRWVLCNLRSGWLAQEEDNTIRPFLLGKHSCLQHEHLKTKKAGKRNNFQSGQATKSLKRRIKAWPRAFLYSFKPKPLRVSFNLNCERRSISEWMDEWINKRTKAFNLVIAIWCRCFSCYCIVCFCPWRRLSPNCLKKLILKTTPK